MLTPETKRRIDACRNVLVGRSSVASELTASQTAPADLAALLACADHQEDRPAPGLSGTDAARSSAEAVPTLMGGTSGADRWGGPLTRSARPLVSRFEAKTRRVRDRMWGNS
jgi:hypothetical protein